MGHLTKLSLPRIHRASGDCHYRQVGRARPWQIIMIARRPTSTIDFRGKTGIPPPDVDDGLAVARGKIVERSRERRSAPTRFFSPTDDSSAVQRWRNTGDDFPGRSTTQWMLRRFPPAGNHRSCESVISRARDDSAPGVARCREHRPLLHRGKFCRRQRASGRPFKVWL